jgi:hypothetical protein
MVPRPKQIRKAHFSVKTELKRALNLARHPQQRDFELKSRIAELQELYSQINPLHIRRNKGRLTAAEAACLKVLEKQADVLLLEVHQRYGRGGSHGSEFS